MQRLSPDGVLLDPARLLYLATLAGAAALGLDAEVGDFRAGKAADFVYLRPPAGSVLAEVLGRVESMDQALGALVTLAGSESVREVRVAGYGRASTGGAVTLADINAWERHRFVAELGWICEGAPWVAERAWTGGRSPTSRRCTPP